MLFNDVEISQQYTSDGARAKYHTLLELGDTPVDLGLSLLSLAPAIRFCGVVCLQILLDITQRITRLHLKVTCDDSLRDVPPLTHVLSA